MSAYEHDDAIRSMLRRARIVSVDDSGSAQLVSLRGLYNDRPQKVVSTFHHGFASNPMQDGEGILLALGGRSDRALWLGGEHQQYRPTDQPQGGATVYDANGSIVSVMMSGGIRVRSIQGHVTVKPVDQSKKVYLGGEPTDGGTYFPVQTTGGPSVNVLGCTAFGSGGS